MRIALYHGFDLTTSAAGVHTRQLARTLTRQGHDVHVLCCDREPATPEFFSRRFDYDPRSRRQETFARRLPLRGTATLHRLPPPALPAPEGGGSWIESFLGMRDADRRAWLEVSAAVVRSVLERVQPDVLHVGHSVHEAGAARTACASLAVPWVVFPHEAGIGHGVRRHPRWREPHEAALAACDAVLCTSATMFRTVAGTYPKLQRALEAKLWLCGAGVDTTRSSVQGDRAAVWRDLRAIPGGGKARYHSLDLQAALERGEIEAVQRYWTAYDHTRPDEGLGAVLDRMPANAEILLYAGDLAASEGVHTAIAALPGVLEQRPRAHLVIAGAGTYREVLEGLVHALATGNQTLFSALAVRGGDLDREGRTGPLHDLLAHASGLHERRTLFGNGDMARHVHFLGRIEAALLRRLASQASVLLLPAIVTDPLPERLLEGFAAGVPPVATYAGGFRDVLAAVQPDVQPEIWERMRLGLEPETRVRDLADRIVDWLADSTREAIGQELRSLAVQRFDWNLVARRTLEAYAAVLARRAAGAAPGQAGAQAV